jgi:PAS domain S-box-containing protein
VFTYLTPAASRVLGYEPAELRGERALDYIHPDDQALVTTELRRGLADPGHTATVEHRFRGAEGEWRWLESRGRSLDETATGTGRIVVVTRDVTERRRREERIAAQNDRLDTFAGVVSHDLQGPLAVASGNLTLYRKTGDEAALDRIEQAHKRMSRLTSTLLALARDGDGEVSDFEPVSLADCATTALETSPLAPEQVRIDDGLPTVTGDHTRLCSVFENLFRNVAAHAGSDARVWVEPLSDEPGFHVADDGPGLPAADAEREALFEAGRSGTDDGTGFGLYIVDAIATAHGWTVSATDRPGGGAQFEFRGLSPVR